MKEVVVISGKGGTGKTSVVSALAGLGPDKVLADCDVDAADLHLILEPSIRETHEFWSGEMASIDPDLCVECGECLTHCHFGAISDTFQVIPEHCEGCGVCAHVCPAGAAIMTPRMCGHWFHSDTRFGPMIHAELGIGEENSGKLVTTVRQASHNLAEKLGRNLVLVDGSPGIGCPVIASLTNADVAIIVAEPTMSAVHDMQRVYELTHHFGVKTLTVINKANINPTLVMEINEYCRNKDIPVIGTLPYDTAFTEAQIKGKTICEHDPEGTGKLLTEMWNKLEKYL
jgi:MinD superfamily P-loop ATPase